MCCNHLPHLLNAIVGKFDGVVAAVVRVEDTKDHGGDFHAVFVFKDVFVEALLELVMVVAGVVEVGEDGDATAGAVFLGVAVDDEVLAAFPIDHHKGTVRFAEECVHGAGDAVLRERDNLFGIVKFKPTFKNLLLVEFQEQLEFFEIIAVRLSLEEVFDLLVHVGAAFGRLEHLFDDLLAALARFRHKLLDICFFVKIGEEFFDESGHGSVVGGAAGVASVRVGV